MCTTFKKLAVKSFSRIVVKWLIVVLTWNSAFLATNNQSSFRLMNSPPTSNGLKSSLMEYSYINNLYMFVLRIYLSKWNQRGTYLAKSKKGALCTISFMSSYKKEHWALHDYSTATFVASWLKWLQMNLYVSKKSTEVISFC